MCAFNWEQSLPFGFKKINSPNFSNRDNPVIDMLVIHNISLPPKQFENNFVEDFFCNKLDSKIHPYFQTIKDIKVSSHLFIKRSGEVVQFVDFDKKAWHAGVSSYKGRKNCNDFSIGIELEGADDIQYNDNQYQVLNIIIKKLCQSYKIKYIVGHNEIAPLRKSDPGKSFKWNKLLNGTIKQYK